MTWVDVCVVLFILIVIQVGMNRGFIKEVFDILTIVGSFLIATHCFYWIGVLLRKVVPIPLAFANGIGFTLVFALFGVIFVYLGGALDLVAKIPGISLLNKAAGSFVAVIKGIVIVWTFFLLLSMLPLSDNGRNLLHHSVTVRLVQATTGMFHQVIKTAASWRTYNMLGPAINKSRF